MTQSEPRRSHRVAKLIQAELGRMLVDEIKDPRVGFATITEVRLSNDLRSARVYVSVYGSESARSESLAGLTAAAGFLKRELGHRLRLKYNPDLVFAHDDSLDRADRINTLVTAIARGEHETPDAEAVAEPVPVQTDRTALVDAARTFKEVEDRKKRRPRRRRRN